MIKAEDIWKSYDNLEVLTGLNLSVNDGETVVILGRSGVGKSVLLRQLIGIEVPDKGNIIINGQNIWKLSAQKRQAITKNMGMLFQGAALFDSMDVFENTAFYLRQHEKSLKEKELRKRVGDALEMVDLTGIAEKMPSDLSGGMRKRAALARLIVYRPRVILYDEPTTGLDPITSMHINQLINRIRRELRATSIVVTHDILSAIEVGDRLAFHHDGKIVHIESKDKFFNIDDPNIKMFFKDSILAVNKHLQETGGMEFR